MPELSYEKKLSLSLTALFLISSYLDPDSAESTKEDSWRDYSELIISYLSIIAADYAIIRMELSCTKCLNHHHIT